jgi:hypothetical protein
MYAKGFELPPLPDSSYSWFVSSTDEDAIKTRTVAINDILRALPPLIHDPEVAVKAE